MYCNPVLLFVFVCPAKSTAFPSTYCLFIAPLMRDNYKFFRHTVKYLCTVSGYLRNWNPFTKIVGYFNTIRIRMVQGIVVPKTIDLIITFIIIKIF